MELPASVVHIESVNMSDRKKTVIDILRENADFVSGEAMSRTLGVSRNAVHKHINSLRKRGYRILGISRRGYKLEQEPSSLSMACVAELTQRSALGHSFRHYDEIESTNVEAKALALRGAPEGTVVVAERQSAGRGRLGRRWTSPAGKGLLFSVVLRPSMAMSDAHMLTLVTAVAAAEAIETETGIPVSIKWPNDLFIADKKVGGILMEVAGEQDEVDWVVVGIGINVNTEFIELPVALRRTATSLQIVGEQQVDRSTLLAALLLSLETHYTRAVAGGVESIVSLFRQRDYLLKKSVSVETRDGPVVGKAAGIDERGALLVELPERRMRRFHSGDVTLHN
jgi:BirA family biotin operon repressor/biotin-[acetyl-CoA-carboxylase] ligase